MGRKNNNSPARNGDIQEGSDADDILIGSRKNDTIFGLAGDDTIIGGRGADTMSGGDGSDTFVFESRSGKDVITDFSFFTDNRDTVVATFEGVRLYLEPDYLGLDWSTNWGSASDEYHKINKPHSGYATGAVSGSYYAYNSLGDPAPINGNDFDLVSGYFTGAWNNELIVTATAWDDGQVVGSTSFEVNTDGPVFIVFDPAIFSSIDSVVFVGTGGYDTNLDDPSNGTHIVFDDLVFSFDSSPGDIEIDVLDLSALNIQDLNGDGQVDMYDLDIIDQGGSAVIQLGANHSITLEGVMQSDLAEYNFIF